MGRGAGYTAQSLKKKTKDWRAMKNQKGKKAEDNRAQIERGILKREGQKDSKKKNT